MVFVFPLDTRTLHVCAQLEQTKALLQASVQRLIVCRPVAGF